MTELLCYTDSYLKEFRARITQVTEAGIVLDRTAFYPGGGGQPSDTGALVTDDRTVRVLGVSGRTGAIVHGIKGEVPVVGAHVKGKIDWERRYQLMRTHTAAHILCGVIWRDYKSPVTGGDMRPLEARMDFELDRITSDFAQEIEHLINAEVQLARPVHIRTLSREEAFQIPDLIRTKINLLPEAIKRVRVVNVEGLDIQADGGTHVANTLEVGVIRVVGHKSKGRINKRLRIVLENV